MGNPIKEINVPKIVKKLDFNQFDKSMQGQSIRVWVNPPAAMLREYNRIQVAIKDLQKNLKVTRIGWLDKLLLSKKRVQKLEAESERLNGEFYAWLAEIWSQHKLMDTHVTPEDVRRFAIECQENDPGLWQFAIKSTHALIMAHQEGISLEKN